MYMYTYMFICSMHLTEIFFFFFMCQILYTDPLPKFSFSKEYENISAMNSVFKKKNPFCFLNYYYYFYFYIF